MTIKSPSVAPRAPRKPRDHQTVPTPGAQNATDASQGDDGPSEADRRCPACGWSLFENLLGNLYCLAPHCPRRHELAGRIDRDTGSLPEDLRVVGT